MGPASTFSGKGLCTLWGAEDLEKPLAALWPVRDQLPSYGRIERVFRTRFLDRIAAFLGSLAPQLGSPPPAQYQRDFASWGLYQVGPLFTEELLIVAGVKRVAPSDKACQALLRHYIGDGNDDSLLARYGDKLLISMLPAARWVSSHVAYALSHDSDDGFSNEALTGDIVVEPAHPKDDDTDDNRRRFKAETWRESVPVESGAQQSIDSGNGGGAYRPVLLSTFLGNWRHRHTELVALDELINVALSALVTRRWRWDEDFWARLHGDVELFVPHTPCLSCVGAFAQLHRWSPDLHIRIAYDDWREWRGKLQQEVGSLSESGR